MRWLKHLLIGDAIVLDELGNVVLLDGNPRITISAHCGSQIAAGAPCWFCRAVCWVLGKFFPGHCTRAWEAEKVGALASRRLPQ